jgi:hypothetical protein
MILSRIHAATNKRGRARTVVIYFDVAVIVMSRYTIRVTKAHPGRGQHHAKPPELQILGAAQKEADRRSVPAYARANGPTQSGDVAFANSVGADESGQDHGQAGISTFRTNESCPTIS